MAYVNGGSVIHYELTRAAYDAMGEYNDRALYFVLETSGKISLYKGNALVENLQDVYTKAEIDALIAALPAPTGNENVIEAITVNGDVVGVYNKTAVITVFSGNYNDLTNKPTLFSGNYNDLTNKPTIPTVNNPTITFKQGSSTKGTITLNQSGNATIEFDEGGGGGGGGEENVINAITVNGTAVPVTNKTAAINALRIISSGSSAPDNAQIGDTYLLNEVSYPKIAVYLSNGNYNDWYYFLPLSEFQPQLIAALSGSSHITLSSAQQATAQSVLGVAAQVQADWNEANSSAVEYIKNKPTIPTVNNATITINQGSVTKGSFTANQSSNVTINLDASGDANVIEAITVNGTAVTVTNKTAAITNVMTLNPSNSTPLPVSSLKLGEFYFTHPSGESSQIYICAYNGINNLLAWQYVVTDENYASFFKNALAGNGHVTLTATEQATARSVINVPGLDANGKILETNLSIMSSSSLGVAKVGYGLSISNGVLSVQKATEDIIDQRTNSYRPIVPEDIAYAVRSVLPAIIEIGSDVSAYSLEDAFSTTHQHNYIYNHIPSATPTYTLPNISERPTFLKTIDIQHGNLIEKWLPYPTYDGTGYYAWKNGSGVRGYTTSKTPVADDIMYGNISLTSYNGTVNFVEYTEHVIVLEVKFSSSALSATFEDALGNTITPLDTLTINAGDIVRYTCRYSLLLGQWVIEARIIGNVPQPTPSSSSSSSGGQTYYYTVSNCPTPSFNGDYYVYSGTHGSDAVYTNGTAYLMKHTVFGSWGIDDDLTRQSAMDQSPALWCDYVSQLAGPPPSGLPDTTAPYGTSTTVSDYV